MVFPVVMFRCEAEHYRTDTFKLWCWRKLLKVPWIARRSKQSILREINPESSLERLTLKLQYFAHLIRTDNSLDKFLMLGKIGSSRRRGPQRMRSLEGITDAKGMNLGKLQKMVRRREAWSAAVQRVTKSQIWLGDRTTTTALASDKFGGTSFTKCGYFF